MSFVQNFPLFAIILSLVCAVISFAANDRWARGLTLFLLSVSVCMQAALLVFCAVNGTSYSYMMGHYPAPWGNEITVGVLESFMALLFAAVMLMSVLGGMPRIRRDIPEHRMRLYWVMIDLAHVALLALCYTNDIFTAYVFIEVLTIASCCLLAARDGGRPLLAAVRYMIFSGGLRAVSHRRHLHLLHYGPAAVPTAEGVHCPAVGRRHLPLLHDRGHRSDGGRTCH